MHPSGGFSPHAPLIAVVGFEPHDLRIMSPVSTPDCSTPRWVLPDLHRRSEFFGLLCYLLHQGPKDEHEGICTLTFRIDSAGLY